MNNNNFSDNKFQISNHTLANQCNIKDDSDILITNKYKHHLSQTDIENTEYLSKHFKKEEEEENSYNLLSLSQESDHSSTFHTLIDQQQSQPFLSQQTELSPPPLPLPPPPLNSTSPILAKSDIISIDLPNKQQIQKQTDFYRLQNDIKNLEIIPSVNDIDKELFLSQLNNTDFTPIFESKYTNRPNFFKKKTCIRDKLPCDDNKSFLYCIAYHISQKYTYLQDYKKSTLDKYIININDQYLTYPVNPIDEYQLFHFEINMKIGINIFYMIQQNKIGILRKTSFKDHSQKLDVVNMLFHKSSQRTIKYLYIASLTTILGYVYNQNMKNKHVCPLCLQILDTAKKLQQHNLQNTSK